MASARPPLMAVGGEKFREERGIFGPSREEGPLREGDRYGCWPSSSDLLKGVHKGTFRRRSALVMTDTELKLMAAAAIMGESSQPNTG